MRGHHPEGLSMYQRVPSRDYPDSVDIEGNLGWPENVAWEAIGNPSWKKPLPRIFVATLSSFLFGYHLGVVNDKLECISLDLGFSGCTLAEGLVVSTCLGGAFLGSAFSGWISDGVGRRRAFQLCALPMIVGACISATTSNLAGMLLGRFLVGTGMGLGPPLAALYVSEVSPAFVRGTYGSFPQIATCFGLMTSLFIGIPSKNVPGWWRVCFLISTIPAALLAILIEFSAESPHWLFKRGRTAETEVVLESLLGAPHVKSTVAELSKAERGGDVDIVKFSELLHGRLFEVVFMGSALFALQHLSRINAVFYFSSTVFKSAGSIVAMILMDRLGRKLLLIWSFLGMAIAMGVQVVAASDILPGAGMYLSVGGMLLFVLTFALGAGPVPSLLLSEIFPNRIRAKAMAVCMAVHWVVNFFIGLLFLQLLELLGPQILYTIFSAVCITAVAFVKKNVVETKGKTLPEIEIALLPAD